MNISRTLFTFAFSAFMALLSPNSSGQDPVDDILGSILNGYDVELLTDVRTQRLRIRIGGVRLKFGLDGEERSLGCENVSNGFGGSTFRIFDPNHMSGIRFIRDNGCGDELPIRGKKEVGINIQPNENGPENEFIVQFISNSEYIDRQWHHEYFENTYGENDFYMRCVPLRGERTRAKLLWFIPLPFENYVDVLECRVEASGEILEGSMTLIVR